MCECCGLYLNSTSQTDHRHECSLDLGHHCVFSLSCRVTPPQLQTASTWAHSPSSTKSDVIKRKVTFCVFQSLHCYLSLLNPDVNSCTKVYKSIDYLVASPHCLLLSTHFLHEWPSFWYLSHTHSLWGRQLCPGTVPGSDLTYSYYWLLLTRCQPKMAWPQKNIPQSLSLLKPHPNSFLIKLLSFYHRIDYSVAFLKYFILH